MYFVAYAPTLNFCDTVLVLEITLICVCTETKHEENWAERNTSYQICRLLWTTEKRRCLDEFTLTFKLSSRGRILQLNFKNDSVNIVRVPESHEINFLKDFLNLKSNISAEVLQYKQFTLKLVLTFLSHMMSSEIWFINEIIFSLKLWCNFIKNKLKLMHFS